MVTQFWTREEYNKFSSERTACRSLCRKFSQSSPNTKTTQSLLKKTMPNVDITTTILPPVMCDYGNKVFIGKNSFVLSGVSFLDVADIKIGDNAIIYPNVMLATVYHPIDPDKRSTRCFYAKPITVGDNVWICANAVVIEGVKIGNNSVVAAGAVVIKDVPDNVLVAGVPAKIKKRLK